MSAERVLISPEQQHYKFEPLITYVNFPEIQNVFLLSNKKVAAIVQSPWKNQWHLKSPPRAAGIKLAWEEITNAVNACSLHVATILTTVT